MLAFCPNELSCNVPISAATDKYNCLINGFKYGSLIASTTLSLPVRSNSLTVLSIVACLLLLIILVYFLVYFSEILSISFACLMSLFFIAIIQSVYLRPILHLILLSRSSALTVYRIPYL